MGFRLTARAGRARVGILETAHGEVPTPAFLPVGSLGAVRAILPKEVEEFGYRMILANVLHLYLRPGEEVLRKFGLHRFAGWPHAILTDSGGFQVVSLAEKTEITEQGMAFRSPVDGSAHFLTPEEVVRFQEEVLGSDVAMPLDHPAPYPSTPVQARACAERTQRWLIRSMEARRGREMQLFAILQGGTDEEARGWHLEQVRGLEVDGYAIGGLSFGEPKEVTWRIVEWTTAQLPEEKPRYLMGMGLPEDLVRAVAAGVDLMDCVLPTRLGRHGTAITWKGRLSLKQARFREDDAPLDEECGCYVCRRFSRAFLRHLVVSGEMLGAMLLTYHNLWFYASLMREIREKIQRGEDVLSLLERLRAS